MDKKAAVIVSLVGWTPQRCPVCQHVELEPIQVQKHPAVAFYQQTPEIYGCIQKHVILVKRPEGFQARCAFAYFFEEQSVEQIRQTYGTTKRIIHAAIYEHLVSDVFMRREPPPPPEWWPHSDVREGRYVLGAPSWDNIAKHKEEVVELLRETVRPAHHTPFGSLPLQKEE